MSSLVLLPLHGGPPTPGRASRLHPDARLGSKLASRIGFTADRPRFTA